MPQTTVDTSAPVGIATSQQPDQPFTGYTQIQGKLSSGRCVVLDGGVSTELGDGMPRAQRVEHEAMWGVWNLINAPSSVANVHVEYLNAGSDVISTNTWGLTGDPGAGLNSSRPVQVHWMDIARKGIETGREAIDRVGRRDDAALAFSINGDIDDHARLELVELLPRLFERDPVDLIIVETITLVRDGLTREAIQALIETGIPVWASFRRCRQGLCGVFGQHWGGPEGDEFGRTARRLEEMGLGALLINCLPPDHVPGMVSWLRDFTDLPLGVYPNLGYSTADGWKFDCDVSGPDYAEMAAGWREEGAQIIGGCCGVRPEHIAAAAARLREMPVGHNRLWPAFRQQSKSEVQKEVADDRGTDHGWGDDQGHVLYPLDIPEIVCEPGVFVPTHGSWLVWKSLFEQGIGEGQRCLDVGCGTGLLALQLARNGAEHVHAIDIDGQAVANTLSNAFRNDVADVVTGEQADLLAWVPRDEFDVVAASLYQMPVDPYEQPSGHRPLDFWGRNLLDHLITLLPALLAPHGVAYLMQLSILGQDRTQELLDQCGLVSRVTDFGFFAFHDLFEQRLGHIQQVEQLSDAYHLELGSEHVMVAYLLEVKAKKTGEDDGV